MKLSNEVIEARRIKSVELHNEIKEDNMISAFYSENGPCCAGCDHWRYFNCVLGECSRSNLMGSKDRISLLGYKLYTGPDVEAGHALTRRDYHCENFIDSDDTTIPTQ